MTGLIKYNVGVQCFPEKKDRQMAMGQQPGSQRRENVLVRFPIRNFLAGRVQCDRHCRPSGLSHATARPNRPWKPG